MSMDYGTDYGYGVNTSKSVDKITIESIQKLLSFAPNYKNEIDVYFEDNEITEPTIKDYLSFDEDDYDHKEAALLSSVIYEAEGLYMGTARDDESNELFVLFNSGFPWTFQGKAKDITREELDRIFATYTEILFGEPLKADYEAPHWFG